MTTSLPVAWWGLAVTAIACVIVGAIAALVFTFSADVTAYYPARIVLGLIVVLIPLAGLEPLGNLANLHWFFLYLMPWVLIARPRSTAGLLLAAALAVVGTLTEPQCLVFLPLAVWAFVNVRRTRLVSLAWALGMAGQTLTYLLAPRVDNPGRPPWASVAEGYVVDAGMSILTSRAEVLGWTIVRIGWWVGFTWVLALMVLAGIGFWLGRSTARAMLVSLVVGSVASWALSFAVNNVPEYYFSAMTQDQLSHPPLLRWATAASAMLAATVPITMGVLVERHPRWWPAAITTLTVFSLVVLVNLTQRVAVAGEPWSGQIESAKPICDRTPDATVSIYTQPAYPTWGVDVPCVVIER